MQPVGTRETVEALERELLTLLRQARRSPELRWGGRTVRVPLPTYLLLVRLLEHGPQRSSELARGIGVDKSTMSRHVAGLERDGLVRRVEDPDDGRAALVTLSEQGRRSLEEARDARRDLLRGLLARWSDHDRGEFTRLLARLNADLAALSPPRQENA